jgi:hypothetical protein
VVRTAAAHPRLSHAVLRDKAFFQFIDRPRRRKANTGLWTGRAARSMPEAQAKWWGTPCQKLFKNSLFKKFLGEPPIPWAEDPAADAKRRREAIPYYDVARGHRSGEKRTLGARALDAAVARTLSLKRNGRAIARSDRAKLIEARAEPTD